MHVDRFDGAGRVLLVATLCVLMLGTVSASAVIDGFEDGDISEYSGDTGQFSVSCSNSFEGGCSLHGGSSNADAFIWRTQSDWTFTSSVNISTWVSDESGTTPPFGAGGFYSSADDKILYPSFRADKSAGNDEFKIELSGSDGISSTSVTLSQDTFYRTVLNLNHDTGQVDAYLYDQSSNLIAHISAQRDSLDSNYKYVGIRRYGNGNYWDNLKVETTNSAPSFDSVSTSPSSWTNGSNIDVNYEVSDDTSVSQVCADVWEDGTQIVSDQCQSYSSSTVNDSFTDLFLIDESDVYYNYTLTATDSDGATATFSESQLIQNLAPKFNLLAPGNNTDEFTYEPDYRLRISDDGDNVPQEEISCTLFNNTQPFRSVSAYENDTQENRTFTGELSAGLGNNTFTAECVDGETENKTNEYTTKRFEIQASSSEDQVYETENISYSGNYIKGEMLTDLKAELYWNGSKKDEEHFSLSNGIDTGSTLLWQEIPLELNNDTAQNWDIEFTYNYTVFDGNSTNTTSVTSSSKTQNVWQSYYLENSYFSPDKKYIETENFKHNAEIHTETKKANLSGTTTYKRNSETDSMVKVDSNSSQATLEGSLDTGIADSFNKSTFQAESEVQVEFNGDSRTITTGNENLEVYRIQLFDTANPNGLNTAESLVFDVDYEEENYDVATRFTMDLSVWKNEEEKIRRFQFQEDAAQTHSYHIYPEWAEYTIQTKPYPEQTQFDLIQYFNDDTGKVRRSYFFPVSHTISNQTTTVPLKAINRTEADEINFEITESGGQPAENTYCRVDRKFGGGDFETVFMIKTGGQGKSQSFAEVNEIYYSFTCYKNGEVIEKFPAQIMQNPMILTLGETETETSLDYNDQFDASCTNNETSLTCEYQSQTESLEQAVLEVDRKEVVTDITVCNKTSDTATGSLTCNGLNTSKHNYQYSIYGEYNNGIKAFGDSGVTGDTGSQYGISGIFITLIIFVFVYAATAFNVPLGIALGTLSMLFSSLAGFLALTPAMRATLIGLAIVAGLVSRR